MGDPVQGRGICPKCGDDAHSIDQDITPFHPRTIEICACGTAWEPLPEGGCYIDEDGTPKTFDEPCNNCAFRPGSLEQQNIDGWKDEMEILKQGGKFFCHKGVPLDPGGETGFHYPKKESKDATEMAGKKVQIYDASKMRLCRGYLNMRVSRELKNIYGDRP